MRKFMLLIFTREFSAVFTKIQCGWITTGSQKVHKYSSFLIQWVPLIVIPTLIVIPKVQAKCMMIFYKT